MAMWVEGIQYLFVKPAARSSMSMAINRINPHVPMIQRVVTRIGEEPRRSSRSRFEDAKRSGVLAIPLVSDFSVVLNKLALQAARQIQAIYERITSTESVFLLSIRRAQTR